MFLERILMFLTGAVFIFGGTVFITQAMNGFKNVFNSVLFGLMGVIWGLFLCAWSITGPPG